MSTGKVLVVDDDRDIRETMVDALADAGYEVLAAEDGLDALDVLRSEPAAPGVILLDLMMPRMNGVQFQEEIARSDAWAQIPIVVISADSQGRARATEMGAKAYLRKPMRLNELYDTVARALGK